MGSEKLGPPIAISSALDLLESTCTGGEQLHGGGEVGPACPHQLGTRPPRVNLHRGGTASRGRRSWVRPSPPARHWIASSQPAQGGTASWGGEKLGPLVATSSALDRLDSTCTGGEQLQGVGEVGSARRHQLGTGSPRVNLHRGGTASWGRRSWARLSPPVWH
jgi:hypothetical protein